MKTLFFILILFACLASVGHAQQIVTPGCTIDTVANPNRIIVIFNAKQQAVMHNGRDSTWKQQIIARVLDLTNATMNSNAVLIATTQAKRDSVNLVLGILERLRSEIRDGAK